MESTDYVALRPSDASESPKEEPVKVPFRRKPSMMQATSLSSFHFVRNSLLLCPFDLGPPLTRRPLPALVLRGACQSALV